jgi:hypothetical protein
LYRHGETAFVIPITLQRTDASVDRSVQEIRRFSSRTSDEYNAASLLPKVRSAFSVTLTVISSVRFRQQDIILLASYLEELSHYPTLLQCVFIAAQTMQAGRSIAPDVNTST